MVNERVSILEVNAQLMSMSEYCLAQLAQYFTQYGIELLDFSFMSINVPQDDPSFRKLKEAIDKAAQLKIVGRDIYQMDRSFDTLFGICADRAFARIPIGLMYMPGRILYAAWNPRPRREGSTHEVDADDAS